MKRLPFAIALALGAISLDGGRLTAQEPVRVTARFVPRLTVAGAFDARNNGRGDPEMLFGVATLEWQTRVPGLALRVDGLYARRDRFSRTEQPCVTCDRLGNTYSFFSSKVTAAGGLTGVTYDVRQHGAFRPYVLAGAGLMRSHDNYIAGRARYYRCDGFCNLLASAVSLPHYNERPLAAAGQVGVGLVYSWRWLSVLAETRYMAVDYSNTRALNGAVPVSLGARF